MKHRARIAAIAAASLAALAVQPAMAQIRAFGNAEGYGAVATGGRAGSVYHVTNLNATGAGSFVDAISVANRIIVFDVGGVINLTSAPSAKSNLNIAGQTAPGGGITINGFQALGLASTSNNIVRHLRIRPGDSSPGSDNGIGMGKTGAIILDHLSIEFGKYNNIDAVSDTADAPRVTIQNSIIADPISNGTSTRGQGFGAHLEATNGYFTLAANLWTNGHSREPLAKVNDQFINNIEYNNETGYLTSGTSGVFDHDLVNNAFIFGPASTSSSDFGQLSTPDTFYSSGNVQDTNKDGVFNPTSTNPSTVNPLSPTPLHASTLSLPTLSVADAYANVIAKVGASLTRDSLDQLVVGQVQTLGSGTPGYTAGTTGPVVTDVPLDIESPFAGHTGLYHKASDTGLANGGLGTIASASRPAGFDVDNDGVADAWETIHGMNPASAADALALNPLGYRMIEQYINELGDTATTHTYNATSGSFTTAASWGGTLPNAMDNAVVVGNGVANGAATVSSGTSSVMKLDIGGNGPAAGEVVNVTGGVLDVYDTITVGANNNASLNISNGTVDTWNIQLGNTVYSPAATTYTGTINFSGGTLRFMQIALGGGTPGAWTTGGSINWSGGLLQPVGSFSINAPIALSGTGGTIDTNGFSGTISGAITGGAVAITKQGAGAVDLTGTNTFTGGLVLQAGTLGIGSDANVGGSDTPITFNGGMLRINGTTLTTLGTHPVNFATFNGGFDIASSSNTFTVAQQLGGSGSLTKAGAGTLVLTGVNSYTGGTTLQAGVTSVSSDANLGANGSPLTFAGGTLRITGTALTNLNNHPPTFSTGVSTIDVNTAGNVFTITQAIGGSGGITKAGAGTLVLASANTFTGVTSVTAGTLKLGNALSLQKATLSPAGGTLDFNGFVPIVGGLSGSGALDLKGALFTVGNNNLDTAYSGVISDSVGLAQLIKIGSGTLSLTGNSTFVGPFVVKAGEIGLTSLNNGGTAGPLGSSSSASAVVLDGGNIVYTGSGHTSNRIFTLAAGGGTITGSGSGGFTLNGTGVFGQQGTGNRTLTLAGNSQSDGFSFGLSDPDPLDITKGKTSLTVNASGGRWIMSSGGARTYSGDTTVTNGTLLTFNASNLLPFGPGKGNLVIGGSGVLEMNGQTLNINGLSGSGNFNNRQSTRTLTLGNGDASATFSGTITDAALSGTSPLSLVKVGTGKQIFSGANTYDGTTTINDGILQFNAANSIGSSGASVTVTSPGTAAAGYAMDQTFLNRIAAASTGTVALAVTSANALNFNTPGLANASFGAVGAISYTGTLTPAGTAYRLGGGGGTLTLPNASQLTGARSVTVVGPGTVSITNANNYTGSTTVASGVMTIASTGSITSPSITSSAGATLNVNGTIAATSAVVANGAVNFSGNAGTGSSTRTIDSLNVGAAGQAKMLTSAFAGAPAVMTVTTGVTIAAGGKLDLTNNELIATSTLAMVRGQIQSGGMITSISDAGTGGLGSLDLLNGTVEVRYTLKGDTNLDGTVDVGDLGALATGYNTTGGATWAQGDSNYDDNIDVGDLGALATNYGSSLATGPAAGALAMVADPTSSVGAVPEPSGLALVGAGVAALWQRRRRVHHFSK